MLKKDNFNIKQVVKQTKNNNQTILSNLNKFKSYEYD